jgi:ATP-dependent RNA helicase DeaD
MDGLDRNDILYFLSDISGVNRKYFTDLSLQKNCTFFDVDMGHVPGFETRFDGIEVDGRAIRVNKDDDDTRSEKPRGAYSKGRGGSNGGGGYSKGGSSHGDGRSSGPSQRRNSDSGASNRPRGAKDGASSRGKKKSY